MVRIVATIMVVSVMMLTLMSEQGVATYIPQPRMMGATVVNNGGVWELSGESFGVYGVSCDGDSLLVQHDPTFPMIGVTATVGHELANRGVIVSASTDGEYARLRFSRPATIVSRPGKRHGQVRRTLLAKRVDVVGAIPPCESLFLHGESVSVMMMSKG